MDEEKSILRWDGLTSMLSGIFFILTVVTLVEFGRSTMATASRLVARVAHDRQETGNVAIIVTG